MKINEIITMKKTVRSCEKKLKSAFDITLQEFRVLQIIGEADSKTGIKPSEISKKMGLNTSSVSILLSSLELKKMSKRKYPLSDRRIVWISLSDNGQTVLDTITKINFAKG